MYVDPQFIIEASIPNEDPMLERLLSMIAPNDTFIDIGAYVGAYSIPVAKLHNSTVNVIAFEPAPSAVVFLRKHLKYNHVRSNVHVEELACSDITGRVSFILRKSTSDLSPSSENRLSAEEARDGYDEDQIIVVDSVTLDDYVARNPAKPDYIKIDVEGAELQVLRGARELLRNHRPVVFCELHRFNWDLFQTTESQLRELLTEVEYEMKGVVPSQAMKELPLHCHVILLPAR